MPRVTRVAAAAKSQGTCSKCGIEIAKGDGYVWWKFRYSGKRVRCTNPACAPTAQDLTQSEWAAHVATFQDNLASTVSQYGEYGDLPDIEGAACDLDQLAAEVREYGEDQEGKADNMPESLQSSPTAELLRERAESMTNAADELERIATELRDCTIVDVTDMDALKEWAESADCSVDRDDHDDEESYMDAVKEAATESNDEQFSNLMAEASEVGFE